MAIYLGPNLRYVHGVGIVPLSQRAGSATQGSLPMGGSGSARPADSRLEDVFAQRWSR